MVERLRGKLGDDPVRLDGIPDEPGAGYPRVEPERPARVPRAHGCLGRGSATVARNPPSARFSRPMSPP